MNPAPALETAPPAGGASPAQPAAQAPSTPSTPSTVNAPAWQALAGYALRPMVVADLDAVLAIEGRAYAHPWTRGNFIDSLAAGHLGWVLERLPPPAERRAERAAPLLCAYYVAMPGFEEVHLLNITVAPQAQGQGLARHLLAHLDALGRHLRAGMLWLEVRESNARARRLYQAYGYQEVGIRKRYYPAEAGLREDAVVMNRLLGASAPAAAKAPT